MTDLPSGEISSEPAGHAVPGESTNLTPLVVYRRDSQPNHQNIQDLELGADLNNQNTQGMIVNAQNLTSLPGLHDPALSTVDWRTAQQFEFDDALWKPDWLIAQEFESYDYIWGKDMIQEPGCSASNAQNLTSLPGLHDPALSGKDMIQEPGCSASNAQNLTSLPGLHDPALSANDMIQEPGCSASNVSFGSRENNKVISCLNVIPQMNNNVMDAEEKYNRVKQGKKPKRDSLTMLAVEKHFGKTLDKASKSLNVSRSTLKRFCREHGISIWPLPKHNGDDPAVSKSTVKPNYINIPDVEMVTVKATYGEDMIKFDFPTSSGLLELKQEVTRRIELNVTRLRLKYIDEEKDLILLGCDHDLHSLLRLRSMRSGSAIKLIVEL